MSAIRVAPSILAADFASLGDAIRQAEGGGADLIHLDVMDGHFVPNLTMGPAVIAAARRSTSLPLDVHLMVEEPERFVEPFASAGADVISVHAEVAPHLHRLLQQVRESGVRVGLALNPLTPLAVLETALPYLDTVLLMTVDPGFGGQEYIPASTARIRSVKAQCERLNPECLIEVDGGITVATALDACAAGAQVLVAGSAVYGAHGTVAENIAALRSAAGG